MKKWIVFYDSSGHELLSYTEKGTFAGERESTIGFLSHEIGISPHEITIKEENR